MEDTKLAVDKLATGTRYRIVFNDGERAIKEAVGLYMGTTNNEALAFSFRPKGGTANILIHSIRQLWETDRPIMLTRVYHGETRVF